MQRGARESISVWREKEKPEPVFSPLRENVKADVCVVGAGITGLTTAYLLQKEGKSAVILDAWGLAAGETCRTTAHLTVMLDERFSNLESLFGKDKARLVVESHNTAIERIAAIVEEEQIDCDFERVDGYLAAFGDDQREDFEKEAEAVRRAGFAGKQAYSKIPVRGTRDIGPGLRFPHQATFHIMNYMIGLAKAFQRKGGRIFTPAHVREVKGGKHAYVKTDDNLRIAADHVVLATSAPINDKVKMHAKQAAYRTYVIAFEVPKDSYPGFLLWDMEDPYHYVRLMRGNTHDMLIVGGEDHKTGQANDMAERYRRLEAWAGRYFSPLGPVKYRWSGQIMESFDSLAFIGRNPKDEGNVYISTGDSGNGITYGTIAGLLISDLIQGRVNAWEPLYDPSRDMLKAAPSFTKEKAIAAGRMAKDWVKQKEVKSIDEIALDEGAILRQGDAKIAAYRDGHGLCHETSAVCTHLGCTVQWNSGEKSWDCPCHGSRFDYEGRILNAPALKPLESIASQIDTRKIAS